jgi:hypothetical protein
MVRVERSAAIQFIEFEERMEWVEIHLKDGRVFRGSAVRNPIRQTGMIINAVTEERHEFSLGDIRSVRRVTDPRSPA